MYPDQYVAFFYHFHTTQDYFECHEVLEELWLETGHDLFYQGLLQVAVGLFHHRNRNLNGARKMLKAANEKLGYYPDQLRGIDVKDLREKVEKYQEEVDRLGEDSVFYPLTILLLDPELERQIKEKFT